LFAGDEARERLAAAARRIGRPGAAAEIVAQVRSLAPAPRPIRYLAVASPTEPAAAAG
jgi:hypothetical protein